jgi:preprotein translocase subunit SecA
MKLDVLIITWTSWTSRRSRCSQFFFSLEDDLIKVFGGDSIRRWVEYLIQDKDVPLESDLLKKFRKCTRKVELYNYELRKNVFQYDDILNTQRKQLFRT